MVDLLNFFEESAKLKKIKRTGWMRAGVPNSETVADHTYLVSLMSMILIKKNLKMDKVLKMALVHDLAEAKAGDLVAERRGITDSKKKVEKEKAERTGMKDLCSDIENGNEIFALWEEYEKGESEYAKFVRQMDRLEMALQAYMYEKESGKDLEEWFQSSKVAMKDPELIDLLNKIIAKRK